MNESGRDDKPKSQAQVLVPCVASEASRQFRAGSAILTACLQRVWVQQLALDNNTRLQGVLDQRRMLQDALRQAMVVTEAAKKTAGKGPPGAVTFAWGAGSHGQLGQPVVNGTLRSTNAPIGTSCPILVYWGLVGTPSRTERVLY